MEQKPDTRIAEHTDALAAAMKWALADTREAWARTMVKVQSSNGCYDPVMLIQLKSDIAAAVDDSIREWLTPIMERSNGTEPIFDTTAAPDEIWRWMVCYNTGVFVPANGDPLIAFMRTLSSTMPGNGPLYLSPNLDGWGIKP